MSNHIRVNVKGENKAYNFKNGESLDFVTNQMQGMYRDKLSNEMALASQGPKPADSPFANYVSDVFSGKIAKDELKRYAAMIDGVSKGEEKAGRAIFAEFGFGGIVAGKAAKAADLVKLKLAQKMDSSGLAREQIYSDTGWFKGVDDQWKFEIDDSAYSTRIPEIQAKVKGLEDNLFVALKKHGKDSPEFKEIRSLTQDAVELELAPLRNERTAKLGKMTTHDELFKSYPEAENISTMFDLNKSGRGGGEFREDLSLIRAAGDESAIKSTALHETQHAIQGIEGFARGGSPGSPYQSGELQQLIQRKFKQIKANPGNAGETDDALYNHAKMLVNSDEGRFQAYKGLAGEAEARAVQARMNMTPAERAANPFWNSFDVPEKDQIIRRDLK